MNRAVASAVAFALLVLGAVAAPAGAAVLVDQTDHPGSLSTGSDYYPPESGLTNQTSQTADDFTIPAGARWAISQVDVLGANYGGMASQAVSVFFYADVGGLPGTQVYSQSATMSTTNADLSIPLSTPAILDPGTYWLSVQVTAPDGTAASEWYWLDRLVKSGSPAAYRSSAVYLGSCPEWGVRTTCQTPFGSDQPDQLFELSGSSGPPAAGPADPADPAAGPAGPRAGAPSNAFSLGKLKLNRKRGTAKLTVAVPGGGSLTLAGKGLTKLSRSVIAAGELKLSVKAKGKPKRKLDKAGSVKLKAQVVFTPAGGSPNAQTRKVVLKKQLRRFAR